MMQKYVFDIYIEVRFRSGEIKIYPAGYDFLEFDHFPEYEEILQKYRYVKYPTKGGIISTILESHYIVLPKTTEGSSRLLTINNVRLVNNKKKRF